MLRLALVALLALAPLAVADVVSTYQSESGSPDCANPGDYGYGESDVIVDAGVASARAGGSRFCYNDFENGKYSASTVAVDLQAAGNDALYASWSGSATSCYVDAFVLGSEVGHPCPGPLAPPDPGWGHVLP